MSNSTSSNDNPYAGIQSAVNRAIASGDLKLAQSLLAMR